MMNRDQKCDQQLLLSIAGGEGCQQFSLLSTLSVIRRMETDPQFAFLMGELARHLLQGSGVTPACGTHITVPKHAELSEPLTNREWEILQLMAGRRSYAEIAESLFISPLTVKTHVHNLFQKLGVNRRRFAIQRALELGLIQ